MKYRPLGKTGLQVSALAMGCMRLPADQPELAAQIIDAAIAAGVNYFETTRGYVGGKCQHLTAGGLKGRSRGMIVSGKARVTEETTAADYRREIELQLQILGVDYLEFFQVGWFTWGLLGALTRKGGALEALRQAQAEGLIGQIGFTGHDEPANVTRLIETGIFDSMTVPYSLVDRRYETAIKRAGELGVGVVAMCPVGGGLLAAPSDTLQQLMPGGAATTVAAALRFVLANPAVSCACSGMNTLEQLRENAATVNQFDDLSPAELAQIREVLNKYQALQKRFCTTCGYCAPCPHGVDIPGTFKLYNYAKVFGLRGWAREQYAGMEAGKRAAACNACGECEPKCPNKIPIRAQLKLVHEYFGAPPGFDRSLDPGGA